MLVKVITGVIAAGLLLAYVSPLVFKMKDVALGIVIVIGLVSMLVDLLQSWRD